MTTRASDPRLPRLFSEQRGFTMVSVMLGMFVIGLLAVGSWQAAVGDIPIARGDQDRKRAYQAAEAGLEWYAYQLARDPNYWTSCTSVPDVAAGVPAPVNQAWLTGADTRTRWRALPNSNARYAIELLPASGRTSCSTADPQGSMLQNGTLRIRSTGVANGDRRQIVSTFRRRTFIDFIYFTDRETLAPVAYSAYPAYVSAGYTSTWAQTNCQGQRAVRNSVCIAIQFPSSDSIEGPLHTNDDSVLVCGTPTFGRGATDSFEVSGPVPGWKQNGGCSGTPNIKGTKVVPAPTLTMPPSNGQLKAVADYVYTGNRCLDFKSNGSFDMYTNITCTGTATNVAPSGASVIYVDHSGACSGGYQYIQKYNNPATCGDVAVKGTYARNFTVGAANDVIIRGNLQKSGDTMMGLVANNFVRVYHPVTRDSSNNCTGNAAGTLSNPQIEAAILALQQSFIVDNWDCGATLGSLTVTGAIAQKWRGPVGTGSGGGATTGYVKDYNYDDRLRYKSPPQFLDPVQSAWRTVRRSELQPAK